MNICIPSQDGSGLDSELHGHFGSAPWFTFVNTETGELEAVANPACGSGGGACHHVGMLAKRGIEAVFSSGLGKRAWSGLKDAGIEIYAAPGRTVRENLALLKDGEAERFDLSAACAGGGNGSQARQRRHRHHH